MSLNCLAGPALAVESATARAKVFWFFFTKKNVLPWDGGPGPTLRGFLSQIRVFVAVRSVDGGAEGEPDGEADPGAGGQIEHEPEAR